ncbi:UbiA family prenyltransferase [Halalkalicoccus subterraneus]|uniref:UbiA family prenyltransferase n=1 Tax=Halalkalicoccus subterraneus TaxID=2675002 RepID=UPI000EFC2951|nr:UbiA family prenyltransferase [Halalkalicoccus subterraneus]
MVRLSISNGDELETLRRWFDRLRETQPGRVIQEAYAVCVQCSLLLAAVGASKVAVVSLLLSLPLNVAAGVAFLVTLAVYNHNKLTDLEEDAVNDPEGAAFFDSRKGLFTVLSVGAYALALGLSALGGPRAFALALFPGVLGVLYSSRWLPGAGPDRLKDVLLVGTGAVALAWAVPLALLPPAVGGQGIGLGALVVLGFFFLRTVVAVELFNVPDVAGDRRNDVGTLPVALGVRPTQYVLSGLNGCSFLLLIGGVSAGVLAPGALVATVGLVYSGGLVALIGHQNVEQLCLASYLEPPLMLGALLAGTGLGI